MTGENENPNLTQFFGRHESDLNALISHSFGIFIATAPTSSRERFTLVGSGVTNYEIPIPDSPFQNST